MKKQKKYFIYSIIIVLFTALFFSCKNDIENVAASITGSPDDEVAAAQEWYNKTQQDTLAIGIARVSSSKTKFSAKPDWKHAYSVKDDDYSAVHTPLSTKERFSFVTAENKQAYEATGDARYISTFTQMVVINEKKDNKTYAFLMTLVPDKAYLESTHFAAFSSNYRKWQKGYSGYVFYHTLDGKFNNGWKFENGKVTMSATQVDENGVDISMGAKRKVSSGTICTTLTYEIWTARCQYSYTISETQGIQNLSIGTCGSYDYQGNQYLEICYDDGNSGGAINNPPPSGTTPTTPPTDECVGEECPMCLGIMTANSTASNARAIDPVVCKKCQCNKSSDLIWNGKCYKQRTKFYLDLKGSIGLQAQASVSFFFPVKVSAAAFKLEQVTSYYITYDDVYGWNYGVTVNSKDYYYDVSADGWFAGIRMNRGQNIVDGDLFTTVKEIRQGLMTQTQEKIYNNWFEDPTKEVFKLEFGGSFMLIIGGGVSVGMEGTYFEMK